MQIIAWWPTLFVLAIATATDLYSRRIPNWLVVPFLLTGVIGSAVNGGWGGLGVSISGVVLGAVAAGVLCWLRAMGMGDLKLCAAIGAWIGPEQMFMALIATGIAGGVLAVGYAVYKGVARDSLDGAGDLVFGFWKRGFRPHPTLVLDNPSKLGMPYAPAIAIGTVFSFFTLST